MQEPLAAHSKEGPCRLGMSSTQKEKLQAFDRPPLAPCLPGTRDQILSIIDDWITRGQSHAKPILWLTGSPGTGKSTIIRTACDKHHKPGGGISAAAFCGMPIGAGPTARVRTGYLAPSLAYQLIDSVPGYEASLRRILKDDTSILHKPLGEQFRSIIVDALDGIPRVPPDEPRKPIVIVLDGLDECQGQEPSTILKVLVRATQTSVIPLQLLISSRPVAQILKIFDHADFASRTETISLDDPVFESDAAITLYLHHSFLEISKARPNTALRGAWFTKDTIRILVKKAAGQFLYAFLVVEFIHKDVQDAGQRLQWVLDPSRGSVVFGALDALYIRSLKRIPPKPRTLLPRLMGLFIVAGPQPLAIVGNLLAVDVNAVTDCLDHFFSGPLPECTLEELYDDHPLSLANGPFRDFLLDQKRSGPFFVNESEVRRQLVDRFLDLTPPHPIPSKVPTRKRPLSQETLHYLTSSMASHAQCFHQPRHLEELRCRAMFVLLLPSFLSSSVSRLLSKTFTCAYDAHQRLLVVLDALGKGISFRLPELYSEMLNRVPEKEKELVRRALGCLVALRTPQTVATLADLISAPVEAVKRALFRLSSVVRIHDHDSRTAHLVSINDRFRHYLKDPCQSGPHSIDLRAQHAQLVYRYLGIFPGADRDLDNLTLQDLKGLSSESQRCIRSSLEHHVNHLDFESLGLAMRTEVQEIVFRSSDGNDDPSLPSKPHHIPFDPYDFQTNLSEIVHIADPVAVHPFDAQYRRLLERVPCRILPLLLRILGYITILTKPVSANVVANLALCSNLSIKAALGYIPTLVRVKYKEDDPLETLISIQPDFLSFLRDHTRSAPYAVCFLDKSVHTEIVCRFLRMSPQKAGIVSFPCSGSDDLSGAALRYVSGSLNVHVQGCDMDQLWGKLEAHSRAVLLPGPPDSPGGAFIAAKTQLDPHAFHERLARVAQAMERKGSSPLDALYTEIVDGVPAEHRNVVRQILGYTTLLQLPQHPDDIAHLTSASDAEVSAAVEQLRAVLRVQDDATSRGSVLVIHRSFASFLHSADRDRWWFIDPFAWHQRIIRQALSSLAFALGMKLQAKGDRPISEDLRRLLVVSLPPLTDAGHVDRVCEEMRPLVEAVVSNLPAFSRVTRDEKHLNALAQLIWLVDVHAAHHTCGEKIAQKAGSRCRFHSALKALKGEAAASCKPLQLN